MCGIFHHAQLVHGGNGIQPVHINRPASQIDRDNGLGALRDGSFDFVQINITRDGVNVGKHRRGTDFNDDIRGGNPGNRRGDDFVARADTRDAQSNFHGASAGVESAYRTSAKIVGKHIFKFLNLGAGGNPAGTQYLCNGGDGGFVYGWTGERKKIVHK